MEKIGESQKHLLCHPNEGGEYNLCSWNTCKDVDCLKAGDVEGMHSGL